MARHLYPYTLKHFKNITRSIVAPIYLGRRSAFNRLDFIKDNVRGGTVSYSDVYKTTIGNLGRLPLYTIVAGIHHPKWCSLRTGNDKRLGNRLLRILMRTQTDAMGSKANHLCTTLNEVRDSTNLSRGILVLPFITNPATLTLDSDGQAEVAEESLNNITQLPEVFYTLQSTAEYKGTYNELHVALGDETRGYSFSNFTFKKGTISVAYGAIVDFTKGKVLAMLTLNREYQEYFLLHKYARSTKKLHPQIFNVVVDEEFSRNTGEHYAKELWTLVRKGMCETMEDGIETEFIDGSVLFQELYNHKVTSDSASLGPLEQIEANAETQERFIQHTVIADTLRKRNIELID